MFDGRRIGGRRCGIGPFDDETVEADDEADLLGDEDNLETDDDLEGGDEAF